MPLRYSVIATTRVDTYSFNREELIATLSKDLY